MRSIFLYISLLLLTAGTVRAQKFGYVDSDFVLSKMPAYANAQKELDLLSANWQKEIETLQKDLEKLQRNYQAEEVLLTEEMKKERKAAIQDKEKELKDYQKKLFGFEGTLFKKRQELIKPVQDEVFTAVEKVAKAKGLQIIFDKSGGLVMIYTNPTHDYTDYVLEELGLAPVTRATGAGAPGAGGSEADKNPTPPPGHENTQMKNAPPSRGSKQPTKKP